jgi:predicted enzyme related to lactoylglutathione lyase
MNSGPRRGPTTMRPNSLVHLELHTGDLSRACAYYEHLLGWRAEEVSTYTAMEVGNVGGGVVECPAAGRPLWLPYVDVPDVDAATERARDMGAKVLLEPRSGPAGRRAVVSSPVAGEVAFWEEHRRGGPLRRRRRSDL